MSNGLVDLGEGVMLEWLSWRAHPRAAFVQQHPHPQQPGVRCAGSGVLDLPGVPEAFPGRPVWRVEQREPLTLTPSLLCTTCGHSGAVKEGKWIPA